MSPVNEAGSHGRSKRSPRYVTILGVALMLISLASAIPVLDVRYDISDEEFEAMSFTNPDSVNAFEEASIADDFDVSQSVPKTTVDSPDGNYKTFGVQDEYGNTRVYIYEGDKQLYQINSPATGPYPIAFSPDGKMYATYDFEDNSQFEVVIQSSKTGKKLMGESVDYFGDSRSVYPDELPYDLSSMFELYWTDDGSNVVFDVLCGYSSDPSSAVGDVLVIKHNVLNVDYEELQNLNGGSASPVVTQPEPQLVDVDDTEDISVSSTDIEELPPSSDTTPSTPAFSFSLAVTAFAAGRRFSKKK